MLAYCICRRFWAMYTIYARHPNCVYKAGNVLRHIFQITIIWPSGWNLSLKIKLYIKHVSEIRFWKFILVGSEGLRSRATICRRYNGHGMSVSIHLAAPFQGKSPLARHHTTPVHVQWHPELARLKLREPRWRTYGYAIHLKMVPPFKARHVESFSRVGSWKLCSAPNFVKYSGEDVRWYVRWHMTDFAISRWRTWLFGGSQGGTWEI